MSSEWDWVRLGDSCEKIGSGATPKGGKDAYLEHGPFYLIRSQNVYNDGFSPSGLAYISEEQAQKLDGVAVQEGDVLLNITGDSVSRVCLALAHFLPARVNQHVAIIRPRQSKFDSRFLRYFLASPYQQDLMLGLAAAGATRNALTKGMIEDFKVPCPALGIQAAISDVLSTLDDRITLLRETNTTLEAIAQALFKSWFVDFDPVRAKAEGRARQDGERSGQPRMPQASDLPRPRAEAGAEAQGQPEGMDATTAALFPDSFEESELGLVPKGWTVRSLDSIADYLNGLALQKFPPSEDSWLPVIKIAQLRKGDTVGADRAGRNIKPEYVIQNGDVLFSWSGSLEVVIWCGGEGALNQHLFKVTSAEYPKWFYYLWTRQHLPAFQQIAASKATTMGHIQRKHLTEAQVVVPPEEVIQVLGAQIEPLMERWLANAEQAQTLTQLRDTLLPRLISGQLRLPEIGADIDGASA